MLVIAAGVGFVSGGCARSCILICLLSKFCCVGAVPLGDDHRVHPHRSLCYLAFNSLPRATRSTGEV